MSVMNRTEQKIFYRKLKTLAIPMAIQQLMTTLVSVSDAVMLGILSRDALSAVSLAGQVQFVYSLFLFAAMQGVSIFAAQYWSNGNYTAVEKILGIGLKMSVLLSLSFTIGAIFLPVPFMHIFASDRFGSRLSSCGWHPLFFKKYFSNLFGYHEKQRTCFTVCGNQRNFCCGKYCSECCFHLCISHGRYWCSTCHA